MAQKALSVLCSLSFLVSLLIALPVTPLHLSRFIVASLHPLRQLGSPRFVSVAFGAL
jgi:hypothetical protein